MLVRMRKSLINAVKFTHGLKIPHKKLGEFVIETKKTQKFNLMAL